MEENYTESSSNETIEIYIGYDRLKANDLAKLLQNLSQISDLIAEDYFARFNTHEGEALPTLDIASMNTGNSIIFKAREGWSANVSTNAKGEIVIEYPKPLGIPTVIICLFATVATTYLGIATMKQQHEINNIELQLKKLELAKAVASKDQPEQNTTQAIIYYIDNRIPEAKPILLDTIKNIMKNPEITKFRVNNIEIKNTENQ